MSDEKNSNKATRTKGKKLSGHARLKSALVLRDGILDELSLNIESVSAQLREVENNIGAQKALDDSKYLEAISSVSNGDVALLAELDLVVRTACCKVQFSPRYAQYLALLLFAYWWRMQKLDVDAFLARLNDYLKNHPLKGEASNSFIESDLQFAAFWMATAAGKTHILHACLAILTEDSSASWDRIILVTPGEALSIQHANKLRELNLWDVFSYPSDGDMSALARVSPSTVIVLDINKLTEVKKGEGMTVPTSVFKDGRNLVFVDEGHKGQKSEQSLWKRLQEDLAGIDSPELKHRGLLIEFSATFGQVAEQEHAFGRYSKSILFDYAYDRFHADQYGKDFWHVKLDGRGDAQDTVREFTLTAALVSYWFQLDGYSSIETQEIISEKNLDISSPLWVLLGLSVIGGKNKGDQAQTSDVIEVLLYLNEVISAPEYLSGVLSDVLSLKSAGGDLLPSEVRGKLSKSSPTDLASRIKKDVFSWHQGDQPVFRLLRNADGELGLGLLRGDQVHYYGVVNVGDAAGLKSALSDAGLNVDEDVFSSSLFSVLDDNRSKLNILIGSRRFAEGWDNYRASSLTLLRLGQGEGSLIIQMFGRVVRFAGSHKDGKRLASPPEQIVPLQTAYVYGLRSGYLETFLGSLYENGMAETKHKECPIHINIPEKTSLRSVKSVAPQKDDFQVHITGSDWLKGLNTVSFSLAANVSMAGLSSQGFKSEVGTLGEDLTEKFKSHIAVISTENIFHEMTILRRQLGWWNFRFDITAVESALKSDKYEVFGLGSTLSLQKDTDLLRLQRVASTIVRRLFEAAYRKQESRYSRFDFVNVAKSGIPNMYRKESYE